MKKRIIGLDILRVIGIIFIFCYHFTDSFIAYGGVGEGVFNALTFFSIMSRPASQFLFIVSGFALMYNSEDNLGLREYYYRRFKGLFIPFYVAYVLMLGIGVALLKWAPWRTIPKWKFVYTILGIDGLASNFSPDFYLIGEWFMSCIVVCYLLFPLLAYCLKRFRYITLCALVAVYVALVYISNPFMISAYTNPLAILLYFYIEMLLQKELEERLLSTWIKISCLLLSMAIFVYFVTASIVTSKQLLVLSESGSELLCFIWALSMLITFKEVDIPAKSLSYRLIKYFSGISWQFILVHHVLAIIYFTLNGVSQSLLKDCVIIFFISLILAELVKHISVAIRILLQWISKNHI